MDTQIHRYKMIQRYRYTDTQMQWYKHSNNNVKLWWNWKTSQGPTIERISIHKKALDWRWRYQSNEACSKSLHPPCKPICQFLEGQSDGSQVSHNCNKARPQPTKHHCFNTAASMHPTIRHPRASLSSPSLPTDSKRTWNREGLESRIKCSET